MDKVDNTKLYNQLIEAYKSAFPQKNGKVVQLDVSKLWKEMKQDKSSELSEIVKNKVRELNNKTMKNKSKYFSLWSKACDVKHDRIIENISEASTSVIKIETNSNSLQFDIEDTSEQKSHEPLSSKYPAQAKVQEKIIGL